MSNIRYLILTLFLFQNTVFAQTISASDLRQKVRAYRTQNEHKIMNEYFELLSIPNNAADRTNIRKNAEHIRDYMKKRGVNARLIETPGNPIVYGEIIVPNATQTMMFYVHYDGQPTDETAWIDHKPFEPVLRPGKLDQGTRLPKPIPMPKANEKFNPDWRVYARSASDDKAPVIGMMTALDALASMGMKPTSNIKFLFEGEEEAGSANLRGFAEANRELLKTDVLFLCDGPLHFSNKPTLFFGVRGVVGMQVTLYGANTSVHSGHYGNWAPDPGMRLSKLLAGMKDEDGRVLIEGFYDTVTPLTASEQEAIRNVSKRDDEVRNNYGIAKPDGGGKSLLELIQLPALNIKGLQSAWVGRQTRNIVPGTATAAIGIRLVKGNDPRDMVNKVTEHIRKQGYHIVRSDPDHATRMKYAKIARVNGGGGYPAARTSMDVPIVSKAIDVFREFHNNDVEIIPSLGGSLPLYIFTDILNMSIVGMPIANFDNNQHQPNEDIRIGHLWNGIETYARMLMMENVKH